MITLNQLITDLQALRDEIGGHTRLNSSHISVYNGRGYVYRLDYEHDSTRVYCEDECEAEEPAELPAAAATLGALQ